MSNRARKTTGCCGLGCGSVVILLFALAVLMLLTMHLSSPPHTSPAASTEIETPGSSGEPNRAAQIDPFAPKPSPGQSADLDIQNLIVKRVTVDGFLGKGTRFRYFFAVRNNGLSPFNGNIDITLLNKMPGVTNGKKQFQCAIQPRLQQVGYIDAHTGPERFHGDASVAGFLYVATVSGVVVAQGRGTITSKFEDLSQ